MSCKLMVRHITSEGLALAFSGHNDLCEIVIRLAYKFRKYFKMHFLEIHLYVL